jgi:hypothetical protein
LSISKGEASRITQEALLAGVNGMERKEEIAHRNGGLGS